MKEQAPAPERRSGERGRRPDRTTEHIEAARASPGAPLPRAIAAAWAPILGPLGDVRVHTGPASATAARALDARAFTVDRGVHFAPGEYQPSRGPGLDLIGHELAHAAQPRRAFDRGAPLVAPPGDPAEHDADRAVTRGLAPTAEKRARVHRVPQGIGLRQGESLPPALMMQVLGDRFLVSMEINAARELAFVIRNRGSLPMEAGGTEVDRVRIPVLSPQRNVTAQLIRIHEDSFTVDLHGDAQQILTLSDEVQSGNFGDSRDHKFRVFLNNQVARFNDRPVEQIVKVKLPGPARRRDGEAGAGTRERVLSTYIEVGDDLFQFSVRRFGDSPLVVVTINSVLVAEIFGDNPNTYVRLATLPERLTLRVVRNEGRALELDLDGDGRTDLRYDVTMADRTIPDHRNADWTSRMYRFVGFDAAGVQLGRPNRHDMLRMRSHPARPPIPSDQQAPADDSDRGTQLPSDRGSLQTDIPAEAPILVERAGGVLDLRIDGNGDRRKELLLRFRPQGSTAAGGQTVMMEIIQISSWTIKQIPISLTAEQVPHLHPLVVRPGDGRNPTVIDVIHRFTGAVPAPRVMVEIEPPCVCNCELRYNMRVGGAPWYATFPYETEQATPLVSRVVEPVRFAGLWVMDVELGEYHDRFRFLIDRIEGREILAVSAMDPDRPGETRAIRLVDGASAHLPERVECNPQRLHLQLGDRMIHITDAIQAPIETDPLVARTHILDIYGNAVQTERRIRFDYQQGSFDERGRMRGLETNTSQRRGIIRDANIEEQYRSTENWGSMLADVLRNACDQGTIPEAAYESFRDAQRSMLRLRWDTAKQAEGLTIEHLDRLIERTAGFLETMHSSSPDRPPLRRLPNLVLLVRGRVWATVFTQYKEMLIAYHDSFRGANDTLQHEASVAATGVSEMREQIREGGDMPALVLRYDAALGSQVVMAHDRGIVGDGLYNAWNRLRQTMPRLRVMAQREMEDETCSEDSSGLMLQVVEDARILQRELAAAATTASASRTEFTGEVPARAAQMNAAPGFIGGHGELFAGYVINHQWEHAFRSYANMMSGVDRWITNRFADRARTGGDEWRQIYQNNQYINRMARQLHELENKPGVMPVAGTFVPDSSLASQAGAGFVPAVPLRLIIFREGGEWHLHDLTPDRPYLCSVTDRGETEPPHSLFTQLNDNDRFPKGILYYQIPNGRGDRIRCTADKEWHEWARDIGLALAVIGLTLATFGTGTVAVVGAWFLAGAAIANAAGAAGELIDSMEHGQATTTSIVLNVLDIVASLAGAGALVSGTVVRSATAAARVGASWTGAAARVAAFADRAYVPMTALSMGADVATVAVMTHDTIRQLNELERQGATPEQIAEAKRGLLLQLAITGGLTALSVRGDLPEIRAGRRNIVLDVVGNVAIARAAGVQLGGIDLNLPTGDLRAHSVARWHGPEFELSRRGLSDSDSTTLGDWHRRWLESPERVHFNADGTHTVVMPRDVDGNLPPDWVRTRLEGMAGADSPLLRTERAFHVGAEVEAIEQAGRGMRVDPLDPEWRTTTRAEMVRRLGGGPDAEAMVRRYEATRLGGLGPGADAYVGERRLVNRLLPDNELERLQNLFPGHEVYLGGAPLQSGQIPANLDEIEITVVVPRDLPADQMAAIERRGELIRMRPDPAFLQRNGLPAGHTIAVRARVVPNHALAGLTAGGAALHRIDNVLGTRGVQLDGFLGVHLNAMGINPSEIPYRVEVLTPEQFGQRFGSRTRGRSVFQVEDGAPVIYARPDASPADMLDEASHLAQMRDPARAAQIRSLDQVNLQDWQRASPQFRLEMFQTKLDLEIDAKNRTLTSLRAQQPLPEADIAAVEGQLTQLRQMQSEIAGLTPRQLSLMNAGAIPMPSYLDDPPWLFGKRTAIEGIRPNRFEVDASTPRHSLRGTREVSPAARAPGVQRVRRVGDTWTERTLITSGFAGEVTRVDVLPDGSSMITVQRAGGATQAYTVESGATRRVAVGDSVEPGQTLAEEASREYRLVEIDYGGGRIDMREEIRMLGPDGGWRQRGSESTFRGGVMEDAARRQADAEIFARGRVMGTDTFRVPHSRGGGGFDDVIVEFSGTGSATTARCRIREIKDYPNRSVPLEEFTAIRGVDMQENLRVLRADVAAAIDGLDAATRTGPLRDMSADQLYALEAAIAPSGRGISVEVVVGPTTRVGAEGHHAATVIPQLRQDIEAVLGYDALVIPPGGRVQSVDPANVDAAMEAARARATR